MMKNVKEIQRIDKIPEEEFSYVKFVDKASADAEKKPGKKEEFEGLQLMWSEAKSIVRIIAYEDNKPMGYLALKKFKDAYKVYTIGVKPEARGKGIASILYDYAISKTKLYSDTMETPAMRKLWTKIYRKYDISGLDLETGKKFEIDVDGDELKSLDPDINLYSDNEDKRYFLVVQKGLRENRWLSLAGLKRD
jgi:GNAT superfamily N-acetyltransferase